MKPAERATTGRAFLVLMLVTAGHTLSETARDALFLTRLSPTKLPWVYLGLAVLGALIGLRPRAPASPRRLGLGLAAAAIVTAGFGVALRGPSTLLVYALYFWTGVFASVVTVELWVLLGQLHTATQAKRLYGLIGAGSVVGAVVGSGASRLLAMSLTPASMLFGSAALVALSAPVALSLPRGAPAPPGGGAAGVPLRASLGRVWSSPYPKRVLTLATLGAVTVTLADFAFKSVVAASVPRAELTAYLSTVSLALSALSLVAQVGVARWLLRRLGVPAALVLLPFGMLAGGLGVALGGGLRAVLGLKAADGALRYSVHRTAVELLMVPVHDAVRDRVKPVIDLVGQRGGQAIASVLILALAAVGAHDQRLGFAVAGLATLWLAAALSVHRHYLDLFRTTLREGGLSTDAEMPRLDVGALETLLVGLNSTNDGEVLGALELLAAQGKERLVPPLLLYHPSKAVVLRALEVFVELGRPDFVPIADRLRDHPDPEVAAAALRARTAIAVDRELLVERAEGPSLAVRAAAVVSLALRGLVSDESARARLLAIAEAGPDGRRELARSIAAEGLGVATPEVGAIVDGLLVDLARDASLETRAHVAAAMARRPHPSLLPHLVPMLEEHALRAAARAAISAIPGAAAHLDRALSDEALPLGVRIHLPRTIAALPVDEATPVLLRHLGADVDGTIRFKVIRALSRLRRDHPGLVVPDGALAPALEDNLERAIGHARARFVLRTSAPEGPARDLLVELLFDKELYALERVCSIFALLRPEEDFVRIFRGLRSQSPRVRSSSRELLETVLRAPYKDRVLTLVDDVVGDASPLLPGARAARFEPVLRGLAADRDVLVSTFATYLAADVGVDLADAELERGRRNARAAGLGDELLEGPLSRRTLGGATA
ncbi:MAG: hypothetical protein JNL38_11885 [Myxococcales bacterium]|nr:hypothetical protein [Myxococcales bacterium]